MRQRFSLLSIINLDLVFIGLIALIKLLIHLVTNTNYGFHRDELLYLAMGNHLDAGYFEVPPFIAFVGSIIKGVFGPSLAATRFLPALSGAIIVFLTGYLAKRMGGNRFAQALAMLCVIIGPVYLRAHTLFQPVVFDQLFWLLATVLVFEWIKGQRAPSTWLLMGVVCGLGLLNKYTMLLMGFSLVLALLIDRQRKLFLTPGPWIAALIAFLIFLPNLIWQYRNDWPFFQHMNLLYSRQLEAIERTDILIEQILMLHPATLIVWISGLFSLVLSRARKSLLWLALMYLIALTILLWFNGKAYYLATAYPVLFAAGAVFLERFLNSRAWRGVKPAIIMYFILVGVPLAPYGIPCLPATDAAAYMGFMAERLGLSGPLTTESGRIERLPQDFVDMHGWPEQVDVISNVYNSLSEQERSRCIIFASNYGQAGAIDLFGPERGLPRAISTSSSYYYFGPGELAGEIALVYGIEKETLDNLFSTVTAVDTIDHEFAIHYERQIPVYLCRDGQGQSLQELWPSLNPN